MAVVESREWYLASYAPEGVPSSEHLKLRTVRVSLEPHSIPDGHLAIQTLLISIDPYLRTKFHGPNNFDGLYHSQYHLNQVITGVGIGRVKVSKDSKYKEEDMVLVFGGLPFAEYCVISSTKVFTKIDDHATDDDAISLSNYLSCLGVPGFAAWISIEIIGKPNEGSNVFISAASGGVGMIAGQLAKLKGSRVIGSTGSDEKVKLMKEEFGYDDGFNYNKEADFDAALTKYFPDGIDVFVDNVGGKMLEAVLNHVNKHARIPLCGMMSQYDKVWTEREGIRNLLNLVGKEVRMEGFMLGSYFNIFDDFAKEMKQYIKEGKLKTKHKINIGIETVLESLNSLFTSSNIGKVIIQFNAYSDGQKYIDGHEP